jgi:glucose/arabinose dehydrogenase
MTLRRLVATLVATATLGLPVVPAAYAQQLEIATVVSGLNAPVFVGHAGDGTNRLFILERAGRVLVLPPGASMGIVFLDISAKVLTTGSEQGLLGLAFHPQYSSNGRFFVFYARRPDGAIQVSEFRATTDPNIAGTQEFPLLTIDHSAATNHNGGMLAFGPRDGYLYIGMGDGGSGGDPLNNGQNLQSLLGKILRLDVSTTPYTVPPTNPFVGMAGMRGEIWAYGLRNPWRFSFDRATGDLWIGDVGQSGWEEIDLEPAGSDGGSNFGWDRLEGTHPFEGAPPPGSVPPVFEYANGDGSCAVTGGYVYRGALIPALSGAYVFADYCRGRLEAFVPRSGRATKARVLGPRVEALASFGEDARGELYVLSLAGTVSRIAA